MKKVYVVVISFLRDENVTKKILGVFADASTANKRANDYLQTYNTYARQLDQDVITDYEVIETDFVD